MLKGFFSSKQEQTHPLSFGRLIQIKHGGIPASKVTFKSGSTKPYEILKDHTHPNVLPILKLSQHSVYTKRLIPFVHAFESEKTEFNRYVVSRLREVLTFIHNVLKREFRALVMESLAVDESGQVILFNFDRTRSFESAEIDEQMLEALAKELTGDENPGPCAENSRELYETIFKLDLGNIKHEAKLQLFSSILANREIFPGVMVKYIFDSVIRDATKDGAKDYKTKAFDFLYSLDEKYFNKEAKALFSILDSNIRVFLLECFMERRFSEQELDAIVSDLSLGLQVKDKTVKRLTIDFAFQHTFSSDGMAFLLDTMVTCTDSESMAAVCEYLLKFERGDLERPIYRLLFVFLNTGKNPLLVYQCIDKYYTKFDKVKITKEILPMLCSRLIERENQEFCFSLVEKLVEFLRMHRDELQSKDWAIKGIKGMMFWKKGAPPSKFEERVSKFSRSELDEWNECEFDQ